MLCATCLKDICRGNRRDLFPPNALQFCSKACLLEHITSMPKVDAQFRQRIAPRIIPEDEDFGNRNCYSIRLGMAFRSWFECHVAEEFVLKKKFAVYYEAHSIQVDDTHVYVPDFWIPRHGVWLEVKGEWRNGAKKKFEQATKLLGAERLLLIPPVYKGWFRQKERF